MQDETASFDIRIVRYFDAPPAAVFAQWLDAEALKDWFAPETYDGLAAKVDPRVGGAWEVHYRSASGQRFSEHGVFTDIVPHERLALTLHQPDFAPQQLSVLVTFRARDGGTEMRFHQTGFLSAEHRDGVAEGWLGCFGKLDAAVVADIGEAEIRALFADWFEASHDKDIEAAMAPIAPTIVSYEHSTPLQVRDIATMRKECLRGFELAGPDFRWDVPDLKVMVRGDLAVTWGLNRMANYADGHMESAMWSRGTRIFQRLDGRWKLVHQHVSFPVDSESGQGRLDLLPASGM